MEIVYSIVDVRRWVGERLGDGWGRGDQFDNFVELVADRIRLLPAAPPYATDWQSFLDDVDLFGIAVSAAEPIPADVALAGYSVRPQERVALRAMLSDRSGRIRAALLEGPPGCGKTALAAALAQSVGAAHVYHLLHSWSDDQELCCGVDVAAAVEGRGDAVRQPGVLALAAERSHSGLVVLTLDEVDKAPERAENLLLDYLQTGRVPVRPGVHVQARPENLLVFATSNGQRDLSDAFLRRVRRVRMQPLDGATVGRLVAERTGVPQGVVTLLRKLAYACAQADEALASLQEIEALVADCWRCATSVADVVELAAQWGARGQAGAAVARSSDLPAKAWAEIARARRDRG